jgi:hypothetical protein
LVSRRRYCRRPAAAATAAGVGVVGVVLLLVLETLKRPVLLKRHPL